MLLKGTLNILSYSIKLPFSSTCTSSIAVDTYAQWNTVSSAMSSAFISISFAPFIWARFHSLSDSLLEDTLAHLKYFLSVLVVIFILFIL